MEFVYQTSKNYLTKKVQLMDEKTVKALIEAGAVKKVRLVANGATLHADFMTQNGAVTATTNKGAIKTWASIDSSARWLKKIGIGRIELEIGQWLPNQVRIKF